ncbi:MAG: hypothetical protein A2W00_03665 [Candidatus Eisenbacteria bacterium RBG_16_71_46]|nr:MAG: hypothetical protein A2W00_03665 [Candidatus Eisenbacteria bacterium RBG_16_71_46]
MRFEFRFGGDDRSPRPAPRAGAPMRVLVLADLGGRGQRQPDAAQPLAERPQMALSHETLETTFARLAPGLRLRLDPSGPELAIEFGGIGEFHPDELFQRLGLFEALRETRRRLQDPATFETTAAELGGAEAATPRATIVAEEDAETIGRLLGSAPRDLGGVRVEGRLREDVRRMVKGMIAADVVPQADPRQAEWIASVDRTISRQTRALLHHPAFQALESTWRSIEGLLSQIEIGEEIQVSLLDVTRQELAADLVASGGELERSATYRQLVERGAGTPGAGPWSVIVGGYAFGSNPEDVVLLGALGAIASRAGGPFLAAATPAILGCGSLAAAPDPRAWRPFEAGEEERWAALRSSAWARWIGLAMPRVLSRLPYGPRTDATERFAFEELPPERDHEAYLWGNPAFACATLLANSFLESGWSMDPGDHLELGSLPAHTYRLDGESRLQPCAEVVLTERALEAILGRGIMPFMSFPDRNAVRLVRFQSLADPAAALAGPWS